MKWFFSSIALGLTLAAPAWAGEPGMAKLGDIMIHDGWARASIGKAPNSAAYMMLMTHGEEIDKLVAVSTPIADKAELHNHVVDDGIAKMHQVQAIEIAPGEPTTLQPGGLHVMLMGLKQRLEEGEALPITLTFEKAGEVTLDLPIRGVRAGMKHGGHKHGGHEHGS